MKGFNAVQLVALFAATPFLIIAAHSATFFGHEALVVLLLLGYAAGFMALSGVVAGEL